MRFVILGDTKGNKDGINIKVITIILKQVKKLNPQPDYIVHLGDLTTGSSDINKLGSMLERFKSILIDMGINSIILPVFGNHEGGENPKDNSSEIVFGKVFNDILIDGDLDGYNRTVYYKNVDNIRLIFLNSCHFCSQNRVSGEQLKWFINASGANMDFKLVFVHIPAYPTGAHFGTSMDLYPKERDNFWSIADKNRIDIVFSGHEHNYSRRIINGSFNTEESKFNNDIYQIISGGGGEKLRDKYSSKAGMIVPPISENHFVLVDVCNRMLILKAYDIKGNIIDEFQINK